MTQPFDPAPADIAAYQDNVFRFAKARPLAVRSDGRLNTEDWQCFLLWRIAEQLERLADYSMVDTMDEPPVEPWRDNGEDDE